MTRILPFVPFFFLCLAILWMILGGWMLISPEKAFRKRNKKKDPTQKDIVGMRINGIVYLAIAMTVILTMKIDVGLQDKPQVVALLENQNARQDYERIIDNFVSKNIIPGLVVAIVDENGSHLFGYGYQGVGEPKITQDTIFEIGSLSKVFTGLLLAEAVDSGSAALDDPIRSCIPQEFITGQAFYDQITLAHLTTHTSGLPRQPTALDFTAGSLVAGLTGGNQYGKVTREKVFSYLSRTAAPKSIGTDFNYSNYGVGLLGACLSNQKGLSYEETLRRIITDPLEMTHTTVHLAQEQEALFASGYRGYLRLGRFVFGMKSQPWLMGEGMVGAGGIRSSGADMLKFLEACIAEEPDFIALAKQPIFRRTEESEVGMGWIIRQNRVGNQTVIWHDGQTGGANSYMAFFADKPYGVFAIANTNVSIQPLAEEILVALGD